MSETASNNATEVTPHDPSVLRAHWDRYKAPHNALRAVVEDVARNFVDDIGLAGQNENQEINEKIRESCNSYSFPYGRMGMLPPALFGDIDMDHVEQKHPLQVPNSDHEIQEMIGGYHEWAKHVAESKSFSAYPGTEALEYILGRLKGQQYPYDEWAESALAMQQALRDEPIFTMDIHRITRAENATYDHDELDPNLQNIYKQHDRYVLAVSQQKPEDGRVNGIRELIQIPVGEYGPEAADKLARMTVFIGDHIRSSKSIDDKIRGSMTPELEELLRKHTARARESYENGVEDYAVQGMKNTLIEGVLSITQTIAFLTAEKIDGYDDFDDLVRKLLESGVIEKFARTIPVGYIGPVTLSGLYIPGALRVEGDKFMLSDHILEIFGPERREHFAHTAAQWALHREKPDEVSEPEMLGMTCPGSFPNGAITTIGLGSLKAAFNAR